MSKKVKNNSISSRTNRDSSCINKACTAVQANLYSLISNTSLTKIETSMKRKSSEIDRNGDEEMENHRKLINLALDSNTKSSVLFNKSQKNITKDNALRYATQQHNLIVKSFEMGEDISNIESISPNIATGM